MERQAGARQMSSVVFHDSYKFDTIAHDCAPIVDRKDLATAAIVVVVQCNVLMDLVGIARALLQVDTQYCFPETYLILPMG